VPAAALGVLCAVGAGEDCGDAAAGREGQAVEAVTMGVDLRDLDNRRILAPLVSERLEIVHV
jgi:hypothetical protein